MFEQMNWDDLRFLRAVAQTGSLSGAARSLGLSHPTVLRRIQRMKQLWAVDLLEKTPSGYVPTEHGNALIRLADDIASRVAAIDRQIYGQEPHLEGTVRITTTDTLHFSFLAPMFLQLRRAFPLIDLEITVSNQMYNLGSRDADITIRPTNAPPETLVGRKMGKIGFAVYLHRDLAVAQGTTKRFDGLDWIGIDNSLSHLPQENWMRRHNFDKTVHLRVNSIQSVLHYIRLGGGRGILACFMGDKVEDLVQVSPRIKELETDLWVLVHPDVRNAVRIRAVLDQIYAFLSRHRVTLEGTDGDQAHRLLGTV